MVFITGHDIWSDGPRELTWLQIYYLYPILYLEPNIHIAIHNECSDNNAFSSPIVSWRSNWPNGGWNLSDVFTSRKLDSIPALSNVVGMKPQMVQWVSGVQALFFRILSDSVEHHALTIGSLAYIPHSLGGRALTLQNDVSKVDIFSRLVHHSVREPTSGKDKWILCHKSTLILFFSFITFENEELCSSNLLYTCLIKAFYMWH